MSVIFGPSTFFFHLQDRTMIDDLSLGFFSHKRPDYVLQDAYYERSWAGNCAMAHPDMMKHMREVHGFDPKTTKATRSMLACLDGQGFYQNTFEYEVNGMKFLKFDSGQKV